MRFRCAAILGLGLAAAALASEPVTRETARARKPNWRPGSNATALRLRYLERHPAFAAQQARVEAMEGQRRTAPASPEALLEAADELAALGTHLAGKHLRYADQARKVAALRKHLPGLASHELRFARAMQEYYGGGYDAKHPKMRELAAQVAALEKK